MMRSSNASPSRQASPPRSARLAEFSLLAISLLFSLLLVEAGFRMFNGLPVLSLKNWRTEHVVVNALGPRALPDPVLGWRLRPNYRSDGFNTLDKGIRRNFQESTVRAGEILAVGDSFTEGWDDVTDDMTWPAQLEKLIGRAVVNGAVGGYATDQIALRAEELLPIVRPKVLIYGLNDIDIYRAGHAPFGAPKPYFSLSAGALAFHPPTPIEPRDNRAYSVRVGYAMRDILGYSAILNALFGKFALNYWYGESRQIYRRVIDDEVAVTCALLDRLKRRTAGDGIRMLLFIQYYASVILELDEPTDNAARVASCARDLDIEVVDQFESLKHIAEIDMASFTSLYSRHGEEFGHMTAQGNAQAAALLAERFEN